MRWLLLFGLVCLPALATAKPKVAVAPLDGDDSGKVAEVVAEAARERAKVTGPEATQKAMTRLDLSGDLDGKAIKKLRKRLGVDALIHGKVEKDGGKKRLELQVSVRGKKTERFSVSFKSATSKKLKDELRDELAKRLSEGEGSDDDDEDKPRRLSDDAKVDRDDDDDRRSRKKKRKRRRDDDEPAERNAITQAALRLGGGGSLTRRTLTYDTTSPTPPRRVGTLSGAVRLEGELYPAAFDTLDGVAASLGLAFELDKTLGLGIEVPDAGGAEAAIDKLHVQIGARYRVAFGASSIAFGASYYRRRYIADRGGPGLNLDMPDVDYTALAPGVVGRFALGPKTGLVLALDVPLMLDAGPIQSSLSYGAANIIAVDLDAGIEYRLGPHYALKAALELSNIKLSFDGKPGTQAQIRMVQGATDRNLGAAVTFEVLY